ncbi:MAG: hypothetical protein WCS52_13810 [bacterium]
MNNAKRWSWVTSVGLLVVILSAAVMTAQGATYTWTNSASGGTWDVPANWLSGAAPAAPDNTVDFSALGYGNVLYLNGNRQIGNLINTSASNRFLYASASGQTLSLATTSGTPLLTISGGTPAPNYSLGLDIRVNITGTNGFTKLGKSGISIDAISTNAVDASSITGTITVANGLLHVKGAGRLPNVTGIVINDGATFNVYELNSDSSNIDVAGRVNSNAAYRLDGGGTYRLQVGNESSTISYNETLGALTNAMGYSSAPQGTIDVNKNSGGMSVSINSLVHDLGASLLIFNGPNNNTLWNDSTFKVHIGSAQGASGTPINGATGTSIIPYARAGWDSGSYFTGWVGTNTLGNIRVANWNSLGSTSSNWITGDNVSITDATTTLSTSGGVVTVNALLNNSCGNLNLNDNHITLTSGLLAMYNNGQSSSIRGRTNNVNGFSYSTITAGLPGVGGELLFYCPDTGPTYTVYIWTPLFTDNGGGPVSFTKFGISMLNYNDGAATNSYSGRTTISQGSIQLSSGASEVSGGASPLGKVPTTFTTNSLVIMNNAMLNSAQTTTLHANRGIGVAGNATIGGQYNAFTINGPISDFSSNVVGNVIFGSCIPNGDNTKMYWKLNGTCNYSGTTTVNMCRLLLGGDNRLPTTTTLYINGGLAANPPVFNLSGFNQSVAGLFGGTNVVKGAVTNSATGTSTLTVTGAGSYDGVLADGGSGSGKYLALVLNSTNQTLTLYGAANTYTGSTTITSGTLALSNTATIANTPVIDLHNTNSTLNVLNLASTYALGAGQTLTGNGVVTGAMTVAGTVSPGNSIGTLRVGPTSFTSGSKLNIELNAGTNDVLIASGNLDVAGATLALSGTADGSSSYVIARYTGTLASPFLSITGMPPTYSVDYGSGSNGRITLNPPPVGTVIMIQ